MFRLFDFVLEVELLFEDGLLYPLDLLLCFGVESLDRELGMDHLVAHNYYNR